MKQYEMFELEFAGAAPEGSEAQVDIEAVFQKDGKSLKVKGFYAGDGCYKVRFLPEEAGEYIYTVSGSVLPETVSGSAYAEPAEPNRHGPVRPEGIHLRYADGSWFTGFGTTVYALAHQSEALMNETMDTLSKSPFNKIRMCVFPKHYNYNHNNPQWYAFERSEYGIGKTFEAEEGSQVGSGSTDTDTSVNNWDVHHPCFAFWDAFEDKLMKLQALGIEADLILFHPYDRWGFSSMPQKDNLVYLDYLLRRLSAFPNVWWSLANEYDLCAAKSLSDWEEIEAFVAENDPYRHMLSSHNCFKPWDWGRKYITHCSWQTSQLTRVAEMAKTYRKPVLIDECRYEGNLPESWGDISGEEMTARFWRVTVTGGHCTHGETFFPGTKEAELNTETGESEVVWWARGGKLHGKSPARIAFLRSIIESLPGPLSALDEGLGQLFRLSDKDLRELLQSIPEAFRFFPSKIAEMDRIEREKFAASSMSFAGKTDEDEAFLFYKDTECCARTVIGLPADKTYRVDVLDTWNMTRETVLTGASGETTVDLPGRLYMAVLAVMDN